MCVDSLLRIAGQVVRTHPVQSGTDSRFVYLPGVSDVHTGRRAAVHAHAADRLQEPKVSEQAQLHIGYDQVSVCGLPESQDSRDPAGDASWVCATQVRAELVVLEV